jgi:carboxymethylenebutenolidase
VTCPVSFHFGEVDPAVPMEEVEAIKQAYANHGNAEIAVYPDAAHNFAMPYKQGYQEAAATASRAAVLRCFQSM